jgi:alpha 1,2-mannosyltransferase
MIHDKDYHPEPFFIHTILSKGRKGLQASKLLSHIRRPRLDGINEPLLVRTLYEFNGNAFTIDLKGPDGGSGIERSMGDGQGVDTTLMRDILDPKIWKALEKLSESFVKLNDE